MRVWIRAYLPLLVRLLRGIQYAGLTGAGVWLLTTPTELLRTALGTVVYIWAACMVLGGTLCAIGTATKLWAGEFTGLVLLITANWIWGVALIGASHTSAKYGVVLVAWGFGLVARELEIFATARGAATAAKQRRRRGDQR